LGAFLLFIADLTLVTLFICLDDFIASVFALIEISRRLEIPYVRFFIRRSMNPRLLMLKALIMKSGN